MALKVFEGLPGMGKSLCMASEALEMLEENKKNGLDRMIASNLKFSSDVEEYFGVRQVHSKDLTNGGLISYWSDARDLAELKNVDVIWEEMSAYCDSTQWQNMPLELKRFIAQHRHRGVRIIGNTQSFSDIDISVRRRTSSLVHVMKLMGSPDPYPNMPPIKRVWGVVLKINLNPQKYKEDKKFEGVDFTSLGGFQFIGKKSVGVFDMFNDIKAGAYPPLRHIERECESSSCNFHKVVHV